MLVDAMGEAEDRNSFSFFNFRGPVSGKVQEIQVENSFGSNNAENRVDYMVNFILLFIS